MVSQPQLCDVTAMEWNPSDVTRMHLNVLSSIFFMIGHVTSDPLRVRVRHCEQKSASHDV